MAKGPLANVRGLDGSRRDFQEVAAKAAIAHCCPATCSEELIEQVSRFEVASEDTSVQMAIGLESIEVRCAQRAHNVPSELLLLGQVPPPVPPPRQETWTTGEALHPHVKDAMLQFCIS